MDTSEKQIPRVGPYEADVSQRWTLSACPKAVHSISYLLTLPVFPGVSKFFIKSPDLPVRTPNLPDKMDLLSISVLQFEI